MSIAELPQPVTTPPPRPARAPAPSADPYATDGDALFEVVRGIRVEKTMGLIENLIAARLYGQLYLFCHNNPLGHAAVETMFSMPGSENDRKPDVAFVSFQSWAADRPIPRVNAWPVVPELAVEVISPTDKAFDVIDKVREYFEVGVRQVWHVYSNVEQVFVFTSPSQVQVLGRGDELSGDPVIPGFRMPVADLFPPAEPAP